mmetsp:Transcript_9271/g.56448  ORF Transcript_9271/g.56448 Transcript_9271/m.56448 type:complete len:100 (+) Transcript_9271:602-901(+)
MMDTFVVAERDMSRGECRERRCLAVERANVGQEHIAIRIIYWHRLGTQARIFSLLENKLCICSYFLCRLHFFSFLRASFCFLIEESTGHVSNSQIVPSL